MGGKSKNGGGSWASWPIVVGGCHRSGTSVLRRALDAHSRIHCGPEIKFFRDFYGDYFEDQLAHIRFARTARDLLPEDDLLDVLGQAFVTIHERAAQRTGKPRWADKAPENVVYVEQWQQLLGDEWVLIHAVRNPLDTLASMREAEFPQTFPPEFDARIASYRRYTEAGLDFGEEHPDRYFRVVYEELTAAPEAVLDKLMDWLGEVLEPVQLAFNTVPHQAGLEDPAVGWTTGVHGDRVGRWRDGLSSAEASTVWGATAHIWKRIDSGGEIWSPGASLA